MTAVETPTLAALAPKVLRILARADSDEAGERTASIEAARRVLDSAGYSFRALVEFLEHGTPEPEPWKAEEPGGDLADMVAEALRPEHRDRLYCPREPEFLRQAASLLGRGHTLTERQEAWLRKIYHRIGGAI